MRASFAAEQSGHAVPHVVADLAHARDRFPLRILERPVIASQPRHDRALLATPHRDQHLRAAGEIVGQLLRRSIGEIDVDLAHRFQHLRVHARPRIGARRDRARLRRISQRVEPRRRHL